MEAVDPAFNNYYPSFVQAKRKFEGLAQKVKEVPFPKPNFLRSKKVSRYLPNVKGVLSRAQTGPLCSKLERGDWEGLKSDLETLPFDAFKAYHEGKISTNQFTTLLVFWSVAKSFPDVQVQPIFNGEDVNPVALDMIRATLKKTGDAEGLPDFLDEAKLKRFLHSMRRQPESARVFFYLSSPIEMNSITGDIYRNAGVNVFSQIKPGFRMVPSLSMCNEFLSVYAGKNKVAITPVIGLSSNDDLEKNGKSSTRDMALPFPGVVLPKKADGLPAPLDIDFIFHDFYHAIQASEIPHPLRRAFIDLAGAVKEVKNQMSDPLIVEYLDQLYERLIDMEHPFFRQHVTLDLPIEMNLARKFLYAIALQEENATKRLAFAKGLDQSQLNLEICEGLVKWDVMGKIVAILHSQGFCEKYAIKQGDIAIMNELSRRGMGIELDKLLKQEKALTPFAHLKEARSALAQVVRKKEMIQNSVNTNFFSQLEVNHQKS